MTPEVEPVELRLLARAWKWGWAVAVLANLPMPLFLGFTCVEKGGVFGMFTGVAVLWLLGHTVVVWSRSVRPVLVLGSGLFALSQVIPVLHFAAGFAAMCVVADELFAPLSEIDAFLVTVLTGGQLLAVALVCGLSVRVFGIDLEREVNSGRY